LPPDTRSMTRLGHTTCSAVWSGGRLELARVASWTARWGGAHGQQSGVRMDQAGPACKGWALRWPRAGSCCCVARTHPRRDWGGVVGVRVRVARLFTSSRHTSRQPHTQPLPHLAESKPDEDADGAREREGEDHAPEAPAAAAGRPPNLGAAGRCSLAECARGLLRESGAGGRAQHHSASPSQLPCPQINPSSRFSRRCGKSSIRRIKENARHRPGSMDRPTGPCGAHAQAWPCIAASWRRVPTPQGTQGTTPTLRTPCSPQWRPPVRRPPAPCGLQGGYKTTMCYQHTKELV